MKKVITARRVTLVPENNREEGKLWRTGDVVLRREYEVPDNRQLGLVFGRVTSVDSRLGDAGSFFHTTIWTRLPRIGKG